MRKVAVGILILTLGKAAWASEVLPGPVMAEIVQVIDGDTLLVTAHPWLGVMVTTRVRLIGVDTPERGGRAGCPAESALAEQAGAAVRAALPEGSIVRLSGIRPDKYGQRVVASVTLADGRDLSDLLMKAGYAVAYDGKRKTPWCP